jgi:hypothetical protein
MPHLGAFVPSNYFAFIYVPVYSPCVAPESQRIGAAYDLIKV